MHEPLDQDRLRAAVREVYGNIVAPRDARTNSHGHASSESCCGGSIGSPVEKLGYSEGDLASAPEGSNFGLGCGNPIAIASICAGETVIDLGSGAGFDCFLASRAAGPTGKVIGVDMTPEMVSKARRNAANGNYTNVEFRLGEIEHLPAADNCADIIISNCVLNLSPDKPAALLEAFRVLKRGGRLAISDIVATRPLPPEIRDDPNLLCGCMSGATPIQDLRKFLEEAGFTQIEIEQRSQSREFIRDWAPGRGVEDYLVSANIRARKPR